MIPDLTEKPMPMESTSESIEKYRKDVFHAFGIATIVRRPRFIRSVEDLPHGYFELTDINSGMKLSHWLYGDCLVGPAAKAPLPAGTSVVDAVNAAVLSIYNYLLDTYGNTVVELLPNPAADMAGFSYVNANSVLMFALKEFVKDMFVRKDRASQEMIVDFRYATDKILYKERPCIDLKLHLPGPQRVSFFLTDSNHLKVHESLENANCWQSFSIEVPNNDVTTPDKKTTFYLRIFHYNQGPSDWTIEQSKMLLALGVSHITNTFAKLFVRPEVLTELSNPNNWQPDYRSR